MLGSCPAPFWCGVCLKSPLKEYIIKIIYGNCSNNLLTLTRKYTFGILNNECMYKKYAYLILIFIFFIFIFFKLQKSNVPYHVDEVSWFFHTVFFDELFLKHNFDKKFWLSYESFDHPQLSKYIFGAYLFSKDKGYAYDRDMLQATYGRWRFYSILHSDTIPKSPFYTPINTMREINLVITFLTLVILFLLSKILINNIFIPLFFVFFLTSNSLFTRNMLTATPDAHYIFFIILAIFSYIQYIRSRRKSYIYLFALFSGLSITAKLTGSLIIIVYVLYLIHRLFRKKKHELGLLLKEFLVVISIIAVVWTVANPTIFYSPVKSSIFYFSERIRTLESFSRFKDKGLITFKERVHATYCISLVRKCHGYPTGSLFANPFLNILFVFFGILYLIQLMKGKKRLEGIFITLLLIVVIIGSTVFIPLKWNRYYLPLTIFLILLEFMGINYIVNFVIKRLSLKIKHLLPSKIDNFLKSK